MKKKLSDIYVWDWMYCAVSDNQEDAIEELKKLRIDYRMLEKMYEMVCIFLTLIVWIDVLLALNYLLK